MEVLTRLIKTKREALFLASVASELTGSDEECEAAAKQALEWFRKLPD